MKKRVVSGIIAVVFLLVALVFRENIVFNILIALLLVLAVMESQVTTKIVKNSSLVAISCVYMIASAFFPLFGFFPSGMLITCIYIFAVAFYTICDSHSVSLTQVFYSVGITLLISGGINSAMYISNLYITKNYMYQSSDCLYFLFIVFGGAWFGDTGAYFIGSKMGRHKISPVISPKKSVEGLIGGIISTVIGEMIVALIWNFAVLDDAYVQFGWVALISALCPIVGLIGDLFFSYIKRLAKIKDYGKIMPGHGGVLDRVDSLIFVAPFVYMFLMYLPIIVR